MLPSILGHLRQHSRDSITTFPLHLLTTSPPSLTQDHNPYDTNHTRPLNQFNSTYIPVGPHPADILTSPPLQHIIEREEPFQQLYFPQPNITIAHIADGNRAEPIQPTLLLENITTTTHHVKEHNEKIYQTIHDQNTSQLKPGDPSHFDKLPAQIPMIPEAIDIDTMFHNTIAQSNFNTNIRFQSNGDQGQSVYDQNHISKFHTHLDNPNHHIPMLNPTHNLELSLQQLSIASYSFMKDRNIVIDPRLAISPPIPTSTHFNNSNPYTSSDQNTPRSDTSYSIYVPPQTSTNTVPAQFAIPHPELNNPLIWSQLNHVQLTSLLSQFMPSAFLFRGVGSTPDLASSAAPDNSSQAHSIGYNMTNHSLLNPTQNHLGLPPTATVPNRLIFVRLRDQFGNIRMTRTPKLLYQPRLNHSALFSGRGISTTRIRRQYQLTSHSTRLVDESSDHILHQMVLYNNDQTRKADGRNQLDDKVTNTQESSQFGPKKPTQSASTMAKKPKKILSRPQPSISLWGKAKLHHSNLHINYVRLREGSKMESTECNQNGSSFLKNVSNGSNYSQNSQILSQTFSQNTSNLHSLPSPSLTTQSRSNNTPRLTSSPNIPSDTTKQLKNTLPSHTAATFQAVLQRERENGGASTKDQHKMTELAFPNDEFSIKSDTTQPNGLEYLLRYDERSYIRIYSLLLALPQIIKIHDRNVQHWIARFNQILQPDLNQDGQEIAKNDNLITITPSNEDHTKIPTTLTQHQLLSLSSLKSAILAQLQTHTNDLFHVQFLSIQQTIYERCQAQQQLQNDYAFSGASLLLNEPTSLAHPYQKIDTWIQSRLQQLALAQGTIQLCYNLQDRFYERQADAPNERILANNSTFGEEVCRSSCLTVASGADWFRALDSTSAMQPFGTPKVLSGDIVTNRLFSTTQGIWVTLRRSLKWEEDYNRSTYTNELTTMGWDELVGGIVPLQHPNAPTTPTNQQQSQYTNTPSNTSLYSPTFLHISKMNEYIDIRTKIYVKECSRKVDSMRQVIQTHLKNDLNKHLNPSIYTPQVFAKGRRKPEILHADMIKWLVHIIDRFFHDHNSKTADTNRQFPSDTTTSTPPNRTITWVPTNPTNPELAAPQRKILETATWRSKYEYFESTAFSNMEQFPVPFLVPVFRKMGLVPFLSSMIHWIPAVRRKVILKQLLNDPICEKNFITIWKKMERIASNSNLLVRNNAVALDPTTTTTTSATPSTPATQPRDQQGTFPQFPSSIFPTSTQNLPSTSQSGNNQFILDNDEIAMTEDELRNHLLQKKGLTRLLLDFSPSQDLYTTSIDDELNKADQQDNDGDDSRPSSLSGEDAGMEGYEQLLSNLSFNCHEFVYRPWEPLPCMLHGRTLLHTLQQHYPTNATTLLQHLDVRPLSTISNKDYLDENGRSSLKAVPQQHLIPYNILPMIDSIIQHLGVRSSGKCWDDDEFIEQFIKSIESLPQTQQRIILAVLDQNGLNIDSILTNEVQTRTVASDIQSSLLKSEFSLLLSPQCTILPHQQGAQFIKSCNSIISTTNSSSVLRAPYVSHDGTIMDETISKPQIPTHLEYDSLFIPSTHDSPHEKQSNPSSTNHHNYQPPSPSSSRTTVDIRNIIRSQEELILNNARIPSIPILYGDRHSYVLRYIREYYHETFDWAGRQVINVNKKLGILAHNEIISAAIVPEQLWNISQVLKCRDQNFEPNIEKNNERPLRSKKEKRLEVPSSSSPFSYSSSVSDEVRKCETLIAKCVDDNPFNMYNLKTLGMRSPLEQIGDAANQFPLQTLCPFTTTDILIAVKTMIKIYVTTTVSKIFDDVETAIQSRSAPTPQKSAPINPSMSGSTGIDEKNNTASPITATSTNPIITDIPQTYLQYLRLSDPHQSNAITIPRKHQTSTHEPLLAISALHLAQFEHNSNQLPPPPQAGSAQFSSVFRPPTHPITTPPRQRLVIDMLRYYTALVSPQNITINPKLSIKSSTLRSFAISLFSTLKITTLSNPSQLDSIPQSTFSPIAQLLRNKQPIELSLLDHTILTLQQTSQNTIAPQTKAKLVPLVKQYIKQTGRRTGPNPTAAEDVISSSAEILFPFLVMKNSLLYYFNTNSVETLLLLLGSIASTPVIEQRVTRKDQIDDYSDNILITTGVKERTDVTETVRVDVKTFLTNVSLQFQQFVSHYLLKTHFLVEFQTIYNVKVIYFMVLKSFIGRFGTFISQQNTLLHWLNNSTDAVDALLDRYDHLLVDNYQLREEDIFNSDQIAQTTTHISQFEILLPEHVVKLASDPSSFQTNSQDISSNYGLKSSILSIFQSYSQFPIHHYPSFTDWYVNYCTGTPDLAHTTETPLPLPPAVTVNYVARTGLAVPSSGVHNPTSQKMTNTPVTNNSPHPTLPPLQTLFQLHLLLQDYHASQDLASLYNLCDVSVAEAPIKELFVKNEPQFTQSSKIDKQFEFEINLFSQLNTITTQTSRLIKQYRLIITGIISILAQFFTFNAFKNYDTNQPTSPQQQSQPHLLTIQQSFILLHQLRSLITMFVQYIYLSTTGMHNKEHETDYPPVQSSFSFTSSSPQTFSSSTPSPSPRDNPLASTLKKHYIEPLLQPSPSLSTPLYISAYTSLYTIVQDMQGHYPIALQPIASSQQLLSTSQTEKILPGQSPALAPTNSFHHLLRALNLAHEQWHHYVITPLKTRVFDYNRLFAPYPTLDLQATRTIPSLHQSTNNSKQNCGNKSHPLDPLKITQAEMYSHIKYLHHYLYPKLGQITATPSTMDTDLATTREDDGISTNTRQTRDEHHIGQIQSIISTALRNLEIIKNIDDFSI